MSCVPGFQTGQHALHQMRACLHTRAGHEKVKVVEQQHLETEQDAAGTMRSMTMTSQPHLWVPGMGNVQIGDVRFHVYSSADGGACKARRLLQSLRPIMTQPPHAVLDIK